MRPRERREAGEQDLFRSRLDAILVTPDAFFTSRAVQFATLTASDKIPAAYAYRDIVAAGGLMSYGIDIADTFRPVGAYAGSILKGEKAADLPVLQSTKFEFVINLKTAKALPQKQTKKADIGCVFMSPRPDQR
jgi:putative ABC transport system substrate-binding protein